MVSVWVWELVFELELAFLSGSASAFRLELE